jgi:hypothetical protein
MIKAGRYDLDEASLGRIYQHVVSNPKMKSWAVITASRNGRTSAENKLANKELEADLRKLGLGFAHADGMWRECKDGTLEYKDCPEEMRIPSPEKVMFIPNISKEDAKALGKKYQQDSVLFADGEARKNGEATYIDSKSGEEFNIGKFTAGKIAQGYTKLKGDKVFTFLQPGEKGVSYNKDGGSANSVDDIVYNTRTNTVGIVRLADEKGETKTDADGNVNTDELEPFNPMKYPHQKDAKVAPSTKKEIDTRGLWKPFAQKDEPTKVEPKAEPGSQKMVANPTQLKSLLPKGIADKMVKNPETGKMIKVKSALKYDKDSPVYKATVAMVKQASKK